MEGKSKLTKVVSSFRSLASTLRRVPECQRCLSDVLVEKNVLINTTTVTRLTRRQKDDSRPRTILPFPETREAGIQHSDPEQSHPVPAGVLALIDNLVQVEQSAKEDNRESTEAVTALFTEVAGADEEIGWAKLKKLLDAYLQKGESSYFSPRNPK